MWHIKTVIRLTTILYVQRSKRKKTEHRTVNRFEFFNLNVLIEKHKQNSSIYNTTLHLSLGMQIVWIPRPPSSDSLSKQILSKLVRIPRPLLLWFTIRTNCIQLVRIPRPSVFWYTSNAKFDDDLIDLQIYWSPYPSPLPNLIGLPLMIRIALKNILVILNIFPHCYH